MYPLLRQTRLWKQSDVTERLARDELSISAHPRLESSTTKSDEEGLAQESKLRGIDQNFFQKKWIHQKRKMPKREHKKI